jgi:hypothetical protein
MADNDSTNTRGAPQNARPASQLTPQEMRALAERLCARAQSVFFQHQPEQRSDLALAAALIVRLVTTDTASIAT